MTGVALAWYPAAPPCDERERARAGGCNRTCPPGRQWGSASVRSRRVTTVKGDAQAMDDRIPRHLPRKLTISLWDFSWYTQTMPGEPFDDLDRAFGEAVERGYNTVRVCAMPYLLFGPSAQEQEALHFTNLGGGYGQRTRWYNARGGAVLDGRAHLLRLFQTAKRHNCYVILSSWEYQQSPSFLATPHWYKDLLTIPPRERFMALAQALSRLIAFLKDHDVADHIAYAEVHNEVDMSKLRDVANPDDDPVAAQKPYLEDAVAALRARHPDILMTVCYGTPPITHMRAAPDNLQVAHFHLYIYGVLGALVEAVGLRSPSASFPTSAGQALLRSDAPPYEAWTPRAGEEWRLEATGVGRGLFYVHDWADPTKWDLWLYDHYGAHREAMRQGITLRLEVVADWAKAHTIPAVLGEGYVGYTPLLTSFEEGPVGKDVAEHAITTCLRLGFWGVILCSNAAPHHPFWQDVAWQQTWNQHILAAHEQPALLPS